MSEFLYHYTSIDILELILKSKKFRFSSLSTVDDTEEENTLDFDKFGRFGFVSCWTDLDEELPTLWSEYT